MAHYGDHPKLTRSKLPADTSVWHWFVCNGPHGDGFNWHREFGKTGVELLTQFIEERETGHTEFRNSARLIAVEHLQAEDPVLILKAIQVLTVVGADEDMQLLVPLLTHGDPRVTANVRSALFERRIKLKC